eukprot:TRINITY_DN26416_c0_g1_i1.p1 TRINITY_DN26416_c0_g1~~TRINITY_DN26416_c0_g1_i1.p1  ORF type:complete len:259 (+),score=42.38 TRINITY_DN26416_c0_g1_i1:70-846(+)
MAPSSRGGSETAREGGRGSNTPKSPMKSSGGGRRPSSARSVRSEQGPPNLTIDYEAQAPPRGSRGSRRPEESISRPRSATELPRREGSRSGEGSSQRSQVQEAPRSIHSKSKRVSDVRMQRCEHEAEGAPGWETYTQLIHKATIGYSGFRPGVYSNNVFSRNYVNAARQGLRDLNKRRGGHEPDVPPNTAVTRKPELHVKNKGLDHHFEKCSNCCLGYTGHQPGLYARSYVEVTKRQASGHDWEMARGERGRTNAEVA